MIDCAHARDFLQSEKLLINGLRNHYLTNRQHESAWKNEVDSVRIVAKAEDDLKQTWAMKNGFDANIITSVKRCKQYIEYNKK